MKVFSYTPPLHVVEFSPGFMRKAESETTPLCWQVCSVRLVWLSWLAIPPPPWENELFPINDDMRRIFVDLAFFIRNIAQRLALKVSYF